MRAVLVWAVGSNSSNGRVTLSPVFSMTTSPLTTSAEVICRVEPPLMTVAIAGASALKLCVCNTS
jgi:hypothetical protein